MRISRSKILAVHCLKVSLTTPTEVVATLIEEAFKGYLGMIAFYAISEASETETDVIEEAIYERLKYLTRKECCDVNQAASGARLFSFDFDGSVAVSNFALRDSLHGRGVNSISDTSTFPAIWGCTIQSAPGVLVTSKYCGPNPKCCTLGDFRLFM